VKSEVQLCRFFLTLAVLGAGAIPVVAQNDAATSGNAPVCGNQPGAPPPTLAHEVLCNAFRIVRTKKADGKPDASVFTDKADELALLALAEGVAAEAGIKASSEVKREFQITKAETARTDKQNGASVASQGSTSLVEKPNLVDLLGVAIENGAIQKEVSGSTLTLSSSLYALTAVANGDTATNYQRHTDLARFGIAASFNITNPDDVLSSATRRQLAEWSVTFRLTPDRSTRSAHFYDFWRKQIEPKISAPAVVITGTQAQVFRNEAETQRREVEDKFFNTKPTAGNPLGKGFIQDYLDAHADLPDDKLVAGLADDILAHLKAEISDKIDSFGLDPATKKKIATVMPALVEAQLRAQEGAGLAEQEIQSLANKGIASFRFTNVRDTTSSTYSVFKFLFEKNTSEALKLDFNLSVSLYSSPDAALNQQTVRDYATALAWQGHIGRSPFVLQTEDQNQVTFSFAGRYQRLLENRHMSDKKADLASAEAQLVIPVFSGMTLPLSFTYSNATELGKKDHFHFNFGLNFDTDKLYRLLAFRKLQQGNQP
jgi:hypothetical protein